MGLSFGPEDGSFFVTNLLEAAPYILLGTASIEVGEWPAPPSGHGVLGVYDNILGTTL